MGEDEGGGETNQARLSEDVAGGVCSMGGHRGQETVSVILVRLTRPVPLTSLSTSKPARGKGGEEINLCHIITG